MRPLVVPPFSWATPRPPKPTPTAGSLSEQLLLLLTSPKTYAGALLHQSNTERFYKKRKKLNQAGQAYLPQNRAEPSAGWEQGSCHAPRQHPHLPALALKINPNKLKPKLKQDHIPTGPVLHSCRQQQDIWWLRFGS